MLRELGAGEAITLDGKRFVRRGDGRLAVWRYFVDTERIEGYNLSGWMLEELTTEERELYGLEAAE